MLCVLETSVMSSSDPEVALYKSPDTHAQATLTPAISSCLDLRGPQHRSGARGSRERGRGISSLCVTTHIGDDDVQSADYWPVAATENGCASQPLLLNMLQS